MSLLDCGVSLTAVPLYVLMGVEEGRHLRDIASGESARVPTLDVHLRYGLLLLIATVL